MLKVIENLMTFKQFLKESVDIDSLNEFTIKWVNFSELQDIFNNSSTKSKFNTDELKGTFPKLVESNPFSKCEYCIALKGKDFYAGIAIGPRKNDNYSITKELPFIYELCSIERGLGSLLVKKAMEKFGNHIWFGVQDKKADEWWNKFAAKNNLTIKKIGTTAWKTPIYELF